jgi:molybdenum cofactor biosynthesis protein B
VTLVLRHWLTSEADAVILSGGTSLTHEKSTVEVVREFLDREIEGFGELFRYLRYKQIGPDAMLSRAVCGIARGKVVFSMPGSRAAAQLAMERLVLPELPYLVRVARRAEGAGSS